MCRPVLQLPAACQPAPFRLNDAQDDLFRTSVAAVPFLDPRVGSLDFESGFPALPALPSMSLPILQALSPVPEELHLFVLIRRTESLVQFPCSVRLDRRTPPP